MFSRAKFLSLAVLLFLFGELRSGLAGEAAYGARVKYREGGALVFPDFSLTPLGSHRVTPPQYPRGWLVHEFLAKKGPASTVVRWSAGTGLIEPASFVVGGRNYQLELSRAE